MDAPELPAIAQGAALSGQGFPGRRGYAGFVSHSGGCRPRQAAARTTPFPPHPSAHPSAPPLPARGASLAFPLDNPPHLTLLWPLLQAFWRRFWHCFHLVQHIVVLMTMLRNAEFFVFYILLDLGGGFFSGTLGSRLIPDSHCGGL